MKLTVCHTTSYQYQRAVTLQPHRMILRPRGTHDVTVIATSISCSPEVDLEWTQDVFGNLIATGSFARMSTRLVIKSHLTIELFAVPWPVFKIDPAAQSYPFEYGADDQSGLGSLIIPEAEDRLGDLQAWAKAFVHGTSTDTLSLLKDLNGGYPAT